MTAALASAVWLSACVVRFSETKIPEAGLSEMSRKEQTASLQESEEGIKTMKKDKEKTIQDKEAAEPKQVSYPVDDYDSWNTLLKENEISQEFHHGLEQFAFQSASQVLRSVEENGVYSPLSLYYALALAGCGAEGETASEILNHLGMESTEELAKQCRKLYQWYTYREQRDKKMYQQYDGEYKSTIRLGNSLWISNRLDVKEEYQQMAAEKFFASSYGVDFASPQAGQKMGEWISEKTNGVLKPQFSTDPSILLSIINTLYFYGAWEDSFAESRTMPDVFTLEDGSEVSCPFLNRTQSHGQFKKEEGCTIAALDTNNHCQMVFFLPDTGRTVGEFLENEELLRTAVDVDNESWTSGEVIWKVPKFSFGSSFKLIEMLKEMGIKKMFDSQAEFGKISTQSLMVSSVVQEAHIGVDENGVEGAAYTKLALAAGTAEGAALRVQMILDRPFLFGIRDTYNDVWLFLGVCRNPAAED